jgi:hypothetical protein
MIWGNEMNLQVQGAEIMATPEMFVELQKLVDSYTSRGNTVFVDEISDSKQIPRRLVILVEKNRDIVTVLEQTILLERERRYEVSQCVIRSDLICKLAKFVSKSKV